jgi:hypothetical protein
MEVRNNQRISVILAANGWCWVGVPELESLLGEEDLLAMPEDRPEKFMEDFDLAQAAHIAHYSRDAELRESIACVCNLIAICQQHHHPINAMILAEFYNVCEANNIGAMQLLDPNIASLILRK